MSTQLEITPRLLEGIRVADGWLSYDRKSGHWFLDGPGFDHEITDFRPPAWGHCTVGKAMGALLSFLSACAESRSYAERMGKDASEGENSDLFPEQVGQWAQLHSDEIEMLAYELENPEGEE